MKRVSFKQGIKELGYEVVEYKNGYNDRYAFATDKQGQMWYFSIGDLRDTHPTIMRRKVKGIGDFHGENNMFDVEEKLLDLGICIIEKRKKCDFNSY